MRRAKTGGADELRPEYKRSDFGGLVRGKYADQFRWAGNVVLISCQSVSRLGRPQEELLTDN